MARKSKGEIHTDLYSECCTKLLQEAEKGDFDQAMAAAIESFEHIPLVINYLSKAAGEVPRFESIDFVLNYAPIFVHQESLDMLSAFLKNKRSVVQKLPHDVLGDLQIAYAKLLDAHRAWNYLVTRTSVSLEELCSALGKPFDRWQWVTTNWKQLGFLQSDPGSSDERWTLVASFTHKVRGKCPRCGAIGSGGLYKLLEDIPCPRCHGVSRFVIISLNA